MIGRIRRKLFGEAPVLPVSARRPSERLGTAYGGWRVLRGGLHEASVVYSAGVGEDTSFDEAVLERFGCRVHAFDPTPRAIQHVQRRREAGALDERFVLTPVAIGVTEGEAVFSLPENPQHVSGRLGAGGERTLTVEVRTLRSLAAERGHARIDLLKLDIEGAEYEVLEHFCADPLPVGQLLFEVHPDMFGESGHERTRAALTGLRGLGYEIFAVSRIAREYHLFRPDLLGAI